MNLYEISKEIEQLEKLLENESSEEELKLQLDEYLKSLEIDKAQKVENICLLIKNKKAISEAVKKELDELSRRKSSLDGSVRWLMYWLSYNLSPKEKYENGKFKLSFRRSESIKINDEDLIPNEFKEERTTIHISKSALKDTIKHQRKEDPEFEIPGCSLVARNNPIIK